MAAVQKRSGDHMPLPTASVSAADLISIPRTVSLLVRFARAVAGLVAWLLAAIGRKVDRMCAAIECWHLGRTLTNGEGHILVLEKSLERTKAEVDDLRIKLILAEKRRDS